MELHCSNPTDVFKFYRGIRVTFTPRKTWWRRLWLWVTRRKQPTPQVVVVTSVDRERGIVTYDVI